MGSMCVLDFMDAESSSLGSPNPNFPTSRPSKTVVAICFLRALSLIRHGASSSPSSRARRIRRAACACMAYSAGPRRGWSRALLRKLVRLRRHPHRDLRRPVAISRRRRSVSGDQLEVALRRVVPGGAGMEYCMLLEEAADYVKCLAMQVRLMQSVVDSESHVHPID